MSKISVSVDNIKWSSVLKAGIFSFTSGFLGFFSASGGFTVDMGLSGAVALIGGGFVSGINMFLFGAWQSFESKSE